MKDAVNQDFKNIISQVKFYYRIKQADIALKIGVKSTYLSDMINGRVPVTESVLEKIYEHYSDIKNNLLQIEIKEQKKDVPFEERPIDEKLNIIYNQNLDIIKENQDLRDLSIKLCETIKDVFYMLNTQIEDISDKLEIKLSEDKKEKLSNIKDRNQLEHN